jgi:hypothetical protein
MAYLLDITEGAQEMDQDALEMDQDSLGPSLEHLRLYLGDKPLNFRSNSTGQVCNRPCVDLFYLSGY